MSFDDKTFLTDLATAGLHIAEVSATPAQKSALLNLDNDPGSNKALNAALRIYGKHYLVAEDGIPGEGEKIPDILSRLRGEDPNVPRMTILGVTDASGAMKGVAFVETYKLTTADGKEGLSHLLTYACMEPPYADNFQANAAFHTGILEKVRKIDTEFGIAPGNSVLVGEVNAATGYNGERTSNKMDPEFEIKTGVPRDQREAYQLGAAPRIITIDGPHSKAHLLQNDYIPPNLAADGLPPGIQTAADLAPHLRNKDVFEGEGEPLFLAAKSAYHTALTPSDIALVKAHNQALMVSVAHGNYGLEGVTDNPALVRQAIAMVPEFKAAADGLDLIAQQQAGTQQGTHTPAIITTGQSNNLAQALASAVAANDVNAILAAIANGAPVPNSPAFLALARNNPALAALPGVNAALTAQVPAPAEIKTDAAPAAGAAGIDPSPKPAAAAKGSAPARTPQLAAALARAALKGPKPLVTGGDKAHDASAFPERKDGEKGTGPTVPQVKGGGRG